MSLCKVGRALVSRCFLSLGILVFCGFALGACNGDHGPMPVSDNAQETGGFNLPNPNSLPRSASYEPSERSQLGRFLKDTLPMNLVEVITNQAVFSPDWTSTSSDLAYGMFEFYLEGFSESAEVNVSSHLPREPETGVWVGLANWNANSWSWFAIPESGKADVGSMEPFLGTDGRILAVVAITGDLEFELSYLIIGPPLAPITVLTADVYEGDAPLTITFDGTASYDPVNDITSYRWDLNDAGKFSASPTEPIQVKTFHTPGQHRVGLCAISNSGWGFTWITIQVNSDWSIEQVDDIGYPGHNSSMELDSDGNPHIASYMTGEAGEGRGLHYARYDGEAWQTELLTVDEGIGQYTSLALDSDDHPHIACYDDVNEFLKYFHHTGTEWLNETIDDASRAGRLGTSIRINSLDQPCISYTASIHLKYTHHDGEVWVTEEVDSEGWPGIMSSLALDETDYPHIAYRGSLGLRYAYYDGATWHTEHVDESAGSGDSEISLALDGEDYPLIAYHHDSNQRTLKYASYDGATWSFITLDNSEYAGIDLSLALDSTGYPHVAYCIITDDQLDTDLMMTSFNGSTWQKQIIADTGSVGRNPSLEFNDLDQPCISFLDSTQECLVFMWIGDM